MALITAAWLYTPQGVEKGSCLNRPAKGVIVESIENDVVVVMDYKKKQNKKKMHFIVRMPRQDQVESKQVFYWVNKLITSREVTPKCDKNICGI